MPRPRRIPTDPNDADDVDAALAALADPVRRGIVELLRVAPRRAGELATALGTSNPAMSKHLKVLRSRAIVEEIATPGDGRARVYRLRPERLAALGRWLEDVASFWSDQLEAFKDAAESAAAERVRPPGGAKR